MQEGTQNRAGWIFIALGLALMAGVFLYQPIFDFSRDLVAERELAQAQAPISPPPDANHAAGESTVDETVPAAPVPDMVAPAPQSPPPPAPSPQPRSKPQPAPKRPATPAVTTPPHAIRQVSPSVPDGIRNRITREIPISIAIRVGSDGRVTSARPGTPVKGDGLRSYLASRAVEAARQWRYSPARTGGRAVPADLIVQFRFRSGETKWN